MNRKLLVFLLCIFFVLGIGIGTVGATSANEEIVAILNRTLNIQLNGSAYIPLDVDGSQLYPITYKGRTYLPVRALASALSVAVDYDDKTRTVLLGEVGLIPLEAADFAKNYTSQFSIEKTQLSVNGMQYRWGIVYTGTEDHYEYSGFVYPKGNYQTFGGVACMEDLDGSTEEVIIKFREDDYKGTVLKEMTIKSGQSIPFEIDIPGVETIYIQNLVSDRTPKSTNPDIMLIGEPYFK